MIREYYKAINVIVKMDLLIKIRKQFAIPVITVVSLALELKIINVSAAMEFRLLEKMQMPINATAWKNILIMEKKNVVNVFINAKLAMVLAKIIVKPVKIFENYLTTLVHVNKIIKKLVQNVIKKMKKIQKMKVNLKKKKK